MAELAPGSVLGDRFEIAGVLGRGGMATVYLARDRVRDERVALKVLHSHLASQPTARDRLRRELAAAGRIRHPRALVAHELFEFDGSLALSMPLHPGHTLAEDVATRGVLDVESLWRLGESLSGALAEAHRGGVVHRDVSPGNVLMDQAREGTLTDFGLARLEDNHSRTATTAVGTAGYTAPELLDGQRAGPAADLYGLGCVLYLAATGRAPFEAATPLATLQRQIDGRFTPLKDLRPELPVALCRNIESLIARDPASRPESARAVAEAMASRQASVTKALSGPVEAALPLANPKLEPGPFALVLRERTEQRQRRARRRLRARRKRQAGLEGLVEGAAELIEQKVRTAMGLGVGREPEDLLREAVAAQAGLPEEALRPVPALSEPELRLVAGVSEAVVTRLAEQAAELGFRVHVAYGDEGHATSIWVWFAPVLALTLAVIGVAYASGMILPMVLWPMIIAAIVGVLAIFGVSDAQRPAPEPLPLAYGADLRPYLTEDYARRLTGAVAPASPAAPRAPADPVTSLLLRTAERLASLEQAIGSAATRLPAPAVHDLQSTLGELRERSRAIEIELRRLHEAGGSHDPRAAEDAAARVAGRLERLTARSRAGETVDPAELASLERALRGHEEQLAAIELDEQRITRLQAALLEIGAAAERCRRTLLHEPDPARSVEDLLGRLRAESAHARAATDELDDARRRAAAQRGAPLPSAGG